MAEEIDLEDFLRIELVRDIHAPLYDAVYVNSTDFCNFGLAFETWGKTLDFDKEKAKQRRATFYRELLRTIPNDKQYAFGLLRDCFPFVAEYEPDKMWNTRPAENGEKERRIFHPRFFRQYFEFRVPSELFGQKQFRDFTASLQHLDEDKVVAQFNSIFRGIINEDFKLWHFMHLIHKSFDSFKLMAQRGLCRGMAENSSHWTRDAFEFDIAIRCALKTLNSLSEGNQRQEFARALIQESASALFALSIPWHMASDKETGEAMKSDAEAVYPYAAEWMKSQYLRENAPSVYDQFTSIDPNQVLFAWRRLGPEAESDQKTYLRNLFHRDPTQIDKFLRLLFRVEMIDDYSALKPLFDYTELADLLTKNEKVLDLNRVSQFFERHQSENREPEEET